MFVPMDRGGTVQVMSVRIPLICFYHPSGTWCHASSVVCDISGGYPLTAHAQLNEAARMTSDQLLRLGMPLGPRIKLLDAMQRYSVLFHSISCCFRPPPAAEAWPPLPSAPAISSASAPVQSLSESGGGSLNGSSSNNEGSVSASSSVSASASLSSSAEH